MFHLFHFNFIRTHTHMHAYLYIWAHPLVCGKYTSPWSFYFNFCYKKMERLLNRFPFKRKWEFYFMSDFLRSSLEREHSSGYYSYHIIKWSMIKRKSLLSTFFLLPPCLVYPAMLRLGAVCQYTMRCATLVSFIKFQLHFLDAMLTVSSLSWKLLI